MTEHGMDSPETVYLSKFLADESRQRIDKARTEIAHRLQKICSNLSQEEFESLVDKMAMAQVRSEAAGSSRK